MTSGRAVAGCAFFVVLTAACVSERVYPRRAHDAGLDSSALASGGGYGTGGAPWANPGTGGAPPPPARLCEASAAFLPADARTGSGCEGGQPHQPDEAGDPPSHCIAPCVWELMKNCRPKGRCVSQDYSAESPLTAGVSCAPDDDWWDVRSGEQGLQEWNSDEFYLDRCFCYSFMMSNATAGCCSPPWWWAAWGDAAGRMIAADFNYPSGPVVCGPFDSLKTPFDAYLPDGVLAPGFTAYAIDSKNQDCDAWRAPQCEPGCCPRNPPKVPQTKRSP